MSREQTVMMCRCRNEERWIRECVARAFEVCQTVVLWDDGSTDRTERETVRVLWGEKSGPWHSQSGLLPNVCLYEGENAQGSCMLHVLHSSFVADRRMPSVRVNEIRDKRALWAYVQNTTDCDTFLCLDGDEHLSRQALREWPTAMRQLEAGKDIVHLSFIYIWKQTGDRLWQRTDAIYGPSATGLKTLNFPRLFTTRRVSADDFFMMTFAWLGSHSFHCGSVPRQSFVVGPDRREPSSLALNLPVIHWGYCEQDLRERKVAMYRQWDPDNAFEGNYNHCLGEPDHHAPGPVQLEPYEDI